MKTQPTAVEQIAALVADKLPDWEVRSLECGRKNAEKFVTDKEGVLILERSAREASLAGIHLAKCLGGVYQLDTRLTPEQHGLRVLARHMAVEDQLNRAKFYAALVSPDFAYVTDGHMVNPDAYMVYRNDPTSPTGVCLVCSGSPDAAYRELLKKAGRATSTSRSFA